MNAIEVREEVLSWMNNVKGSIMPTQGERGLVIGLINNAVRLTGNTADANARRHQVLAWLFRDSLNRPNASVVSAKELTPEMWRALLNYAEAHQDDSGKWVASNGFSEGMRLCLDAMVKWESALDAQIGFDVL